MNESMLYHYTSLEGLIGILRSQSIWASHCEFLNDSSEFHQALNFSKGHASNIFMEDDYLSPIGWGMRDALEHMEKHDIYVSSFSEKPDLLSQWRGYCPQGAGVCIGFDANILENFCSNNDFKLSKCLYDHKLQQEQISEFAITCLEKFPSANISRIEYDRMDTGGQCNHVIDYKAYISKGDRKKAADTALSEFCDSINECAPMIKNHGFHEEAEWRIVARNPKEIILHRSTNSHLVPYIELPVIKQSKNVIRKIIIGPNPNTVKCTSSVLSLLRSHSLDNVKIVGSAIPFSNW